MNLRKALEEGESPRTDETRIPLRNTSGVLKVGEQGKRSTLPGEGPLVSGRSPRKDKDCLSPKQNSDVL